MYSESCPDCGTSTTATIIKVKKVSTRPFRAPTKTKVAKVVVPKTQSTVIVKPVAAAKLVKTVKTAVPAKMDTWEVVISKGEPTIKVKPIAPTKTVKIAASLVPANTSTSAPNSAEPINLPKPAVPPEEPKHEIKQSNLSIEEDIITNPRDYETLAFDFDLKCQHSHFFAAGSTLPVSKGKAYCPICGEQLRKPGRKKRPKYHQF